MILEESLLKIKKYFYSKKSNASEDCFLGYLVWKDKYLYEPLMFKNALVIKSSKNSTYQFPIAEKKEDIIFAINELLKLKNLVFERLTECQKNFLEDHFPFIFDFEEDRANADYIYEIESLSTLKGKKLSKKRNHLNAFLQENINWKIQEINESNIESVLQFAKKWYEKKNGGDCEIGDASLEIEKKSLLKYVLQLDNIGADGIVLFVDEKVVAFTVGQKISDTVYDTVFEKALEEVRGSYNMINREFAKYLKEKYPSLQYINRESDVNMPGLRQAKLSYMPSILLKKFSAKAKN